MHGAPFLPGSGDGNPLQPIIAFAFVIMMLCARIYKDGYRKFAIGLFVILNSINILLFLLLFYYIE